MFRSTAIEVTGREHRQGHRRPHPPRRHPAGDARRHLQRRRRATCSPAATRWASPPPARSSARSSASPTSSRPSATRSSWRSRRSSRSRLQSPHGDERRYPGLTQGGGLGRDRRVRLRTPFGPRPVVERGVVHAELEQGEVEQRRRHARAAAGHHRPGQVDAGGGERPAQLAQRASACRRPRSARHSAGSSLPGCGPSAGPARGSGSRAWNRPAERASTTCSRLLVRLARIWSSSRWSRLFWRTVKWRSCGRRRHVGQRAALGPPLRQAAVQHRDVVVAHEAEQPPHPGRGDEAVVVVDDDPAAVAEAQLAHPRAELGRRRHHVRVQVLGLADLVEVEEHGARDVRRLVLGPGVALGRRQEPGGVHHPHVGRVQMRLQPVGADQGVGHGRARSREVAGAQASQDGTGRSFSRRNSGLNSLLW